MVAPAARTGATCWTAHMTVRLNPYLSFSDNAREAMTFYQQVFGGDLQISTFAELGASDDPALGDNVMHSMLEAPNGLVLMGADTPPGMETTPNGSISLSGDDEATLRGYWDALVEGGTVTVPLEQAPWGDTFGMCTDRFGIPWLVNIAGTPQ
jgi:PhnB protein